MKTTEAVTFTSDDPVEASRLAVLQRFKVEELQHLGQSELLLAQSLAGHGDVWGFWKTPKSISPGNSKPHYQNIDLAKRLRDILAKEPMCSASLDTLIDEGVLLMTRVALIARLVSTGGRQHSINLRLKPSTISFLLYYWWPRITAQAIRCKSERADTPGMLACLTDNDVRELNKRKRLRIELDRLNTLAIQGLWSDVAPLSDITQTTNPAGAPESRPRQVESAPHPPIPDDYMSTIGPRVLWIIRDLGPHLLNLLEALPAYLETVDWSLTKTAKAKYLKKFVAQFQQDHPWQDQNGLPLVPPFPLITGPENKSGHDVDAFEWPPRTWSHLKILSQTLQSSHLFVTLLTSAGRCGEVAGLQSNCVVTARDGKDYLRGWTYKLSDNLFGDERQWPAPEVLVDSMGQQARLAGIWSRLPERLDDEGLPVGPRADDHLWVFLSATGAGKRRPSSDVSINAALMSLAQRVGMDPKPGGKNLHAHRFRKTIGRLAGIALFNSPLVLKRLFGHKSIEMTLHYILCDPDIRTEAENVLRELRIMHCAEALEEIHEAMASGAPLPNNGGPGASRFAQSVFNEEERLAKSGRLWGEGSAYDLAFLITANGQGWRLIRENIVCAKAPGGNGLCQQSRNKGEPNTSNCKPECDNRIVLMRHRRDIEAMAEQYLDIAYQAKKDGQVLVLAHTMDNLREELEAFPDLKEKFLTDPAVQSLLKYCEEVGA